MTATMTEPGQALAPTMSADEAQEFHRALKRNGAEQKIRLFIMRRDRGFAHFFNSDGKAYTNIGDYAASELDVTPSTVTDWTQQVESTMDALKQTPEQLLKLALGKKPQEKVLLPITVSRALLTLPDPDLRHKAYTQMEELKGNQAMTDAEFGNEWRKLTKRLATEAGFVKPAVRARAAKHEENGATPSEPHTEQQVGLSAPPVVSAGHSETAGTPVPLPKVFDFDDKGEALAPEPLRFERWELLEDGAGVRFWFVGGTGTAFLDVPRDTLAEVADRLFTVLTY